MPKRMSALDRAQRELEAELRGSDSQPAVEELARSQRLLAEALNKSKRLRRAADEAEDEEEDEVSEQQEDDEDEEDEEEDEDQDPDDPDEGTGRDDLRGTVGRKKKGHAEKSRRPVRKSRPKWAGSDEDEDEEDDEREDDFEDVQAGGNGAYAGKGKKGYYRNEDANHEEDEEVPPDGPDVADGDDEDVYTIGAHKVHSERAMRRSAKAKAREAVYRSFSRVPGAEEVVEAEPFLANLVDTTATLAERLEKSARSQGETRDLVRALIPAVATLSKAVAKLSRDMELVKSQPVTSGTPWGIPLMRSQSAKGKKGAPLAKSRGEILSNAEGLMRSGQMDSRTYQALGGAITVEDMSELLTPDQRRALGFGGVA